MDLKLDEDVNIVIIKLCDNLKWFDGKDVIVDDVIFFYEVIGYKDYIGICYDDNFMNIVGMEDYYDGKLLIIFGIEKVNDKEVKIIYKEVYLGM